MDGLKLALCMCIIACGVILTAGIASASIHGNSIGSVDFTTGVTPYCSGVMKAEDAVVFDDDACYYSAKDESLVLPLDVLAGVAFEVPYGCAVAITLAAPPNQAATFTIDCDEFEHTYTVGAKGYTVFIQGMYFTDGDDNPLDIEVADGEEEGLGPDYSHDLLLKHLEVYLPTPPNNQYRSTTQSLHPANTHSLNQESYYRKGISK